MHPFFEHLRRRAYDALDVKDHVEDVRGWIQPGFDDALHAISEKLPGTDLVIAEVGTWKGASSIRIAEKFGSRLKTLVCVDTWLGAPEFYTTFIDDPQRFSDDEYDRGWPTVFHVFTKNVKKRGLHDVVVPFPMSSAQASDVFEYHHIEFDAVYIDAAHEYDAVAADVKKYWPLVRDGGVIWGDDYGNASFPGLKRAVDEFVEKNGHELVVMGEQWMVFKDPRDTRP